jgi:hypothetical protein
MKICLSCREEYVDRMESCSACSLPLVDAKDAVYEHKAKETVAKEALLKEETLAFMEGSLQGCREVEQILTDALVPCAVYPASLSCDDQNATLGAACMTKYLLLIRPSDLERCKDVLEGRFESQVAKEGMGSYVKEAVLVDEGEIVCPACQERGTLENGACSSCGLFLGAPN